MLHETGFRVMNTPDPSVAFLRCWTYLLKGKGVYSSLALHGKPVSELYVGRHLPYGITQCYLPPVNAPRLNPASKLVLDLPTPEGRKTELT